MSCFSRRWIKAVLLFIIMPQIIYSVAILLFLLAILFLLHYCLFTRIIKVIRIKRIILIFILASLTGGFILIEIISHYTSNQLVNIIYFFFAVWLGAFFLLLIGFGLLDLGYALLKFAGLKADYRSLGIGLLSLVLFISVYSVINAAGIKINKISLRFSNLENDVKIIQLSDVHLGAVHSMTYLEKIVRMANQLKPDFVLITGDLLNESDSIAGKDLAPLKNLQSTYGTYFVTGNHEKYFGVDKALSLIKEGNITALRNEIKNIGGIQLIGIDYPDSEFSRHNEVLKNLETDKNLVSVLMYHPPSGTEEAEEKGINLQLSGHTHNGQIFPFSIFERLVFKYVSGLHKLKNNSYLYVSAGTGTWGPPMRFLSQSEITEIDFIKE